MMPESFCCATIWQSCRRSISSPPSSTTHSISGDIYAMGGTPVSALNIAAFPEDLSLDILEQILHGSATIARQAGVAIIGGHTIKDDEPKYGMAVTGTIDPRRIVRNAGARAGDALVLTKPLGTGITCNRTQARSC
jgi:selenium donor protein